MEKRSTKRETTKLSELASKDNSNNSSPDFDNNSNFTRSGKSSFMNYLRRNQASFMTFAIVVMLSIILILVAFNLNKFQEQSNQRQDAQNNLLGEIRTSNERQTEILCRVILTGTVELSTPERQQIQQICQQAVNDQTTPSEQSSTVNPGNTQLSTTSPKSSESAPKNNSNKNNAKNSKSKKSKEKKQEESNQPNIVERTITNIRQAVGL